MSVGYATASAGVVGYVADELGRAAPAALSLKELADKYMHPVSADLVRIRKHEGLGSDREAIEFLVLQAVEELRYAGKTSRSREQIVAENGGFRLAVAPEELVHEGRQARWVEVVEPTLRDLFNSQTGEFSVNSRDLKGDDREELRESMRAHGWLEQFPAIVDERGVVLVGHRRLAVARELGMSEEAIRSRTVTLHLGDDDEATVARVRLALASNLGAKKLTAADKRKWAEALDLREWSQQRIAEALDVSQQQVSRYLSFTTSGKRNRPKGEGVGRGSGATGRKRTKQTPTLEAAVLSMRAKGKGREEICKALNLAHGTFDSIVAREEGREEAETAKPEPQEVEEHACPRCGYVHATPPE